MAALLIARFDGETAELTRAYDRAHALIMSQGGDFLRRVEASLRGRERRPLHHRRVGVRGAHPKPLAER